MANFSLLVQKKYNSLASEQKQIFIDEYNRKKKTKWVAFILWFFLGWHYAYLKKWGWLILFIFTAGGFFIWWIIDLFRVSKMVNEYNNNLALDILRDITLMFGEKKEEGLNQETKNFKNDVNAHYLTSRNNSEESYLWFVIPVLIVVFLSVSAYTKPDRLKMENEIANKMMEHNPDMVKVLKNLFFGEEMKEEYVENFITSNLKNEGYNNIVLYESNWIIFRKLVIKDSETNINLIKSYGFLGKTFVFLKYKENKEVSENEPGINEDVNNVEKANENQPRNYITPSYPKYQPIKNEVEYRPIERNLDNEVEIKNSDNKNEILREDSIKIN